MKFKSGDILPRTVMEAVTGETINLPGTKRLVHLQFGRFVDCPICSTHIAEFMKRARAIKGAGIEEVIVFHSSPKSIRSYQKDVPFLMVGDPKKAIYRDFGVETSLGFMSLKALGVGMRGMAHGHSACDLPGPLGAAGRLPDRAGRTDQRGEPRHRRLRPVVHR